YFLLPSLTIRTSRLGGVPGKRKSDISVSSLSTRHLSIQMEIVNTHNDMRRMVKPTASNMLKMVSFVMLMDLAGCGENILMSSRIKSWPDVIQYFYEELKYFKYGFGRTRANVKIGHYTQLVWPTSHQLGCALAYCPHKTLKYFYVCQYCPGGNYVKRMNTPYKKGEPCGDCPHHCDNGLCTNPCMHVNKYSNCDDLVGKHGCATKDMMESCPATCKCPTEIR
uniref:ShKT domain-containing protein n=1 Tax=Equus asinus asinus TaxID=83772 RepID=A0A8C4L5A2_EQUAS